MNKPGFKAVIIDDEPLALEGIRRVCAASGLVSIVGEALDGPSGLELIARTRPDAVFLDISMPGMSGLEVAGQLRAEERAPHIVLVTAYDHFATEAFDLAVVDYVLKPIDADRLSRAIRRVSSLVERASQTARGHAALWVPHRGTVVKLPVREIRRVDAEGDYVRIWGAEHAYLLRATMKDLADRLDGETFLRIHRSTVIARKMIHGIRHASGGSWVIVDIDGKEHAIGRKYLADVRAALFDNSLV